MRIELKEGVIIKSREVYRLRAKEQAVVDETFRKAGKLSPRRGGFAG